MAQYEVLITKTETIIVDAGSAHEAFSEAVLHLDGENGYSEYQNDGWEPLGMQFCTRIGEDNE